MNVMRNRNVKQANASATNFKRRLNFRARNNNKDSNEIINKKVLSEITNPPPSDSGSGETRINNKTANVNSTTESRIILVLTEGRGNAKGEVGLASIDVNSPKLILCQISDNPLYSDTLTKIQILDPSLILLPDTMFEKPKPQLVEFIVDNFPSVQFVPIQRRLFNSEKGLEMLTDLASRLSQNVLQIASKKYYSLAATAALLEYMKGILYMNFVKGCLKIEYQTKHHGILIDINTSIRLELLYSLSNEMHAIKKFSLFSMLNHCVTAIGRRHLRAQILEPSCNVEFIRNRQEQVKILLENSEILAELSEKLTIFRGVHQLLKIAYITPPGDNEKAIETNIQLAIMLKQCLEGVESLKLIVEKTVSESFEHHRQVLEVPAYKLIIEKIDGVLQADIHKNSMAQKHFQHIYAVKSGYNATIDVLRVAYKENFDKIHEYFNDITEQSHLPLKLLYSVKYAHHFQMKNPKSIGLPEEFQILTKKGSTWYLTTSMMLMINEKLKIIAEEIIKMSNAIICNMLIEAAQHIEVLHQLIGVIVDLDVIQSLTESSNQDGFSCSKFGSILKLEKAFHPLLNIARRQGDIILNNVMATPQFNFHIIHGPNMSGKTIYIKMIAIIQIMAQIGCFVPAMSAELRIVDRIFSRLGFQDNIEQKASSFTVELREMEFIHSNLTVNSLVIMDELCRSCNPQEGELICWKYCEKLLRQIGLSDDDYFKADETGDTKSDAKSDLTSRLRNARLKDVTRPFVFLTTHFKTLHKLDEKFENLTNLHLEVIETNVDDTPRLQYTYKIKADINRVKNYGLTLAKCVRLPDRLLQRADEIVGQVHDNTMISTADKSKNNSSRKNRSTRSANLTVDQTILSEEMPMLQRDVFNIFSIVQELMSQGSPVENSNNDKTLEQIQKRVDEMINKMSPEFKTVLAQISCAEIIAAMNSTSKTE